MDLKITAIEQCQGDDNSRKLREKYWQNQLGTWAPWGINGDLDRPEIE